MLVRHYEWAGYDVLAITDHWVRTEERSTKKLLVIPSTELNAWCGAARERRPRAGPGRAGRPGDPRQRVRAAARGRRLDPRERRRPLHRPHLLERSSHRAMGELRGAARASRSGTPAASSRSGAATPRSTGTRRSSAAGSGTRSRRTTRITRATTAALPRPGCAPPRRRRRRCSQPSHRRVLRLDGADDPRRRRERRRRDRALQPGRQRHALRRPGPRLARECRDGSAIRTGPMRSSAPTTD